jgi:hypothetical protein
MCKRQCAGDQEPLGDTMCRRSGTIGRHNVQEIKEHEGEIERVQETMCRRPGNIKDRVNLYKRQCAGDQGT